MVLILIRHMKRKKRRRKRLINTNILEYVIELVLLSGYLKNADPLSLILSAKVGAGKTEILKRYRGTKGIKFISEATAYGIQEKYLNEIEQGKIKHLIIGDLLVPLSKQKKTRDIFIAFMNTLIEEGIESIFTYARNWESNKPVKCGLITAIAEPDLMRTSRRWYEMGFLSRAIPLTYSYSNRTKIKIYKHIAKSYDISEMAPKKIWLPNKPVNAKPNYELNIKLIELSIGMEKWEKVYGFRRQEQLQVLLMANALKNKRKHVIEEDYETILELSEYINLDYKEI